MSEIDLGEDLEFHVKYRGETHYLREPSAKEIGSYQKRLEGSSGESATEALLSFVSSLGLPIEVANAMPASKLNFLITKIMEGLSKKN